MAKKKQKPPSTDLIDSLIDDINKNNLESKESSVPIFIDEPISPDLASLSDLNHQADKSPFNSKLLALTSVEPKKDLSPIEPEKTIALIQNQTHPVPFPNTTRATKIEHQKTIAVEGFAGNLANKSSESEPPVKIAVGKNQIYGSRQGPSPLASTDAALVQAENLKIAQVRIIELEKQIDKLRVENEDLAFAGDVVRTNMEKLLAKVSQLEKDRKEVKENYQNELLILKGNLQFKEDDIVKSRLKIDELESRLRGDFKKIRIKERELENRLELLRAEKTALIRAKDENILDLKKKIDHLNLELDTYKKKCAELNKNIENNQESLKRTVRALRLALANLGITEDDLLNIKKVD